MWFQCFSELVPVGPWHSGTSSVSSSGVLDQRLQPVLLLLLSLSVRQPAARGVL